MTSAAILQLENQMLLGPVVNTYPDVIDFVKKLISINTQLASFPKTTEKTYVRRAGILVELPGQTWAKPDKELKFKLFSKLSSKMFKNEIAEIDKEDVPFHSISTILQKAYDRELLQEQGSESSLTDTDANFDQQLIMFVKISPLM